MFRTSICATLLLLFAASFTIAQPRELVPTPAAKAKEAALIEEIVELEVPLTVDPERSKLLRFKRPVIRYSVTHPDVLTVVQFSPTEFEVIGRKAGTSGLTFWFGKGEAGESSFLRYGVENEGASAVFDRKEQEFNRLQARINELFPNSFVQLIVIGDKLLVRGQAVSAQEAARILAVLRK